MKNLQAYREQLQELNQMIDRLERGELSIHELVEMEKLTAELHAKSVILRYKAFEAKVHGEESPIIEASPEEGVHDAPEPEAPVEELPPIDFSMFDASEEEEEEDIHSVFEPLAENAAPQPLVEEEMVIEEKVEEKVVEVQESVPAPEPAKSINAPKTGTSFWEQVKTDDDSLSSRFAGSKLDTLIGAFGLNEKLRFINDLFDGSSESFSDAIKMLDGQSNFESATTKVNELADVHGWDPEEESVAEFMVYVKRRYA